MSNRRPASPIARLRRIYDPAALCHTLAVELLDHGKQCDHTFTITRASFAYYAPDVNVDPYIQILEELGAHCDCEVAYNVCAKYA